jgi:hypothetical protein
MLVELIVGVAIGYIPCELAGLLLLFLHALITIYERCG